MAAPQDLHANGNGANGANGANGNGDDAPFPRQSSWGGIPVGVEFRDLEYEVRMKVAEKKEDVGQMKPILRGVSGVVLPGEMLCILGPSGGGKTSLIQTVCGRIRPDGGKTVALRGTVKCNGEELAPSQFRRISGLVTQEDVLNAALTVRETLMFAAKLRLPQAIRKQRVDHAIALLQLDKCAASLVGDETVEGMKGISGGEKRRLAIATEILDPDISVLILDEPTSGLDAASALNVANLLRSLADKGLTVAATLHQPRPAILSQFQKLMVLAEGRTIYLGPPADFVGYFQGLGCPVPAHEVPHDWLLDVLNPALDAVKALAAVLPDGPVPEGFAARYAESALSKAMVAGEAPKIPNGQALLDHVRSGGAKRVGWCQQFCVLIHRTALVKMREPICLATQVGQAIFMGALFGALYFDCYDKDSDNIAILDTQMAISMIIVMIAFMPFDVLLTFPKERRIYLREKSAGLYGTTAFFVARILADMPFMIISAVIMSLITWPMMHLKIGLGWYCALNSAGILTGAALLQMVGTLSANFEQANMLAMVILMLAMLFSPAFVRQLPSFLSWAKELSFIGLLSEMTMYLEFQNIGELNPMLDHQLVLEEYNIGIRSDENFASACLVLAMTWIVARLIGFLGVKYLHTGQSWGELCSGA